MKSILPAVYTVKKLINRINSNIKFFWRIRKNIKVFILNEIKVNYNYNFFYDKLQNGKTLNKVGFIKYFEQKVFTEIGGFN